MGGTSLVSRELKNKVMGLSSSFSWWLNGIYCFIALISINKHFSSSLLLEWMLK